MSEPRKTCVADGLSLCGSWAFCHSTHVNTMLIMADSLQRTCRCSLTAAELFTIATAYRSTIRLSPWSLHWNSCYSARALRHSHGCPLQRLGCAHARRPLGIVRHGRSWDLLTTRRLLQTCFAVDGLALHWFRSYPYVLGRHAISIPRFALKCIAR